MKNIELYCPMMRHLDFHLIMREYLGMQSKYVYLLESLLRYLVLKKIGVPIFVAHGNADINNVKPEEYISKLNKKIKRSTYFGIEVAYIFISLPIIDKNRFIECAITKAVKKQDEYKNKVSGNC